MPSFRTIFLLVTTTLVVLSAAAPIPDLTSSPTTQDQNVEVEVERSYVDLYKRIGGINDDLTLVDSLLDGGNPLSTLKRREQADDGSSTTPPLPISPSSLSSPQRRVDAGSILELIGSLLSQLENALNSLLGGTGLPVKLQLPQLGVGNGSSDSSGSSGSSSSSPLSGVTGALGGSGGSSPLSGVTGALGGGSGGSSSSSPLSGVTGALGGLRRDTSGLLDTLLTLSEELSDVEGAAGAGGVPKLIATT